MPSPKPRPDSLLSLSVKQKVGCGRIYVHVSFDEDGYPFEVFIQARKCGDCQNSQLEPVGKLCSHMLRCGIDVNIMMECLKDVVCPTQYIPVNSSFAKKTVFQKGVPVITNGNSVVLSCSDGIYHGVKKALIKMGWTEEDGRMVKGVSDEITT